MNKRVMIAAMSVVGVFTFCASVWAHPGHAGGGLATGAAHPLTGLDHVVVMLAIGLWAVQLGGRAVWLLPATFLSAMLLGGLLGALGMELANIEAGIVTSVFVLGMLVALAARVPLSFAMILTVIFAVCHGAAHMQEIPTDAPWTTYGLGLLISTGVLHMAGLISAVTLRRVNYPVVVRVCGVAMVALAVLLAVK